MKKENKTLEILLKVFLAVGIVVGIFVIVKILYGKYKKKLNQIGDEGYDCDFQCLEDDGLECDCENCEYAGCDCDDVIADVVEAEA